VIQERERLARGVYHSGLRHFIGIVLGLVTSIIQVRIFGAEVIGGLTLIASFIVVFRYLSSFGIPSGLTREITRCEVEGVSFYPLILTAHLCAVGLAIFLAIPFWVVGRRILVSHFGQPELVGALAVYLLFYLFLFTLNNNHEAVFRALQRIDVLVIVGVGSRLAHLLFIGILAWLMGRSVLSLVLVYGVAASVAVGSQIVLLPRSVPVAPRSTDFDALRKQVGRLFSFGIRLLPTAVAEVVIENTDFLMVAHFLPIVQLGYYRVAFGVFRAFFVLPRILASMLFPSLSRMSFAEDNARIERYYVSTLRYGLLLVFPVVVGIVALSREILQIYGAEFVAAQGALCALSIGIVFNTAANLSGSVLGARGRPQAVSAVTAVGAFANFALNYFLIPIYGILGAALASSLAYVVICAGAAFAARRLVPIRPIWSLSLWAAPPALLMGAVVTVVRVGMADLALGPRLAVLVPSGVLAYAGALRLMRTLSHEDASRIKMVLRSVGLGSRPLLFFVDAIATRGRV